MGRELLSYELSLDNFLDLKIMLKKTCMSVFVILFLTACVGDQARIKHDELSTDIVFYEVDALPSEVQGLKITSSTGQVLFQRTAGTVPRKEPVTISGGRGSAIDSNLKISWIEGAGWSDVPVGDPRRTDQYYREDLSLADRSKLVWLEGSMPREYTIAVSKRIYSEAGELIKANPKATLKIKIKIEPNSKLEDKSVQLGWEYETHANIYRGKPSSITTVGEYK